jgi:hypothetical protein
MMKIGKRRLLAAWVALLIGGSFVSPALAAGSDVVHYPRAETYKDTAVQEHDEMGVPMPRTRAFAHARWADDAARRSSNFATMPVTR